MQKPDAIALADERLRKSPRTGQASNLFLNELLKSDKCQFVYSAKQIVSIMSNSILRLLILFWSVVWLFLKW